MTDALQNLATLSERLNDASDLLSHQIGQVEAALNQLHLGVSVWVVVSRTQEDVSAAGDPLTLADHVVELGYGKHKGKWGLLFSDGWPDWDDYHVSFLRDASREDRLKAVEKFADLLGALQAKVTSVTEEVTAKAAEMKQFASALSKITR